MSTIAVNRIETTAGAPLLEVANGQASGAFAPVGMRNRLINSDMRIDQRNAGASVNYTNAGSFGVDRWQTSQNSASATTLSIQRSTVAPAGFTNSLLTTVTTGASITAGTTYNLFTQKIEGFNTADLAWGAASAQTITLSFWVRSSLTGSFGVSLHNSAYNRFYGALFTISAANTWEYKTITVPGDTSGTWLTDSGIGIRVVFDMGCSTNNVADPGSWLATNADGVTGATRVAETTGATFYITGVQLEAGFVATPFERRDYGRELMMCQRYYRATSVTGTIYGEGTIYAGYGLTGSSVGQAVPFPVAMRAAPTIAYTGSWTRANCSASIDGATTTSYFPYINVNSNGSANQRGGTISFTSEF